jgi:hypothetical protein
VIEILTALLIAMRPAVGGHVLGILLFGIIANRPLIPRY